MDALPVPAIIFAVAFWVVFYPVIRAYFKALGEGEHLLERFDPQSVPQPIQEELNRRASQLEVLGYQSIGYCKSVGRIQGGWEVFWSIWVRGMTVAEICVYHKRDQTIATTAIGQDFLDGTSLVVTDRWPRAKEEGPGWLFLPGVNDLSTLDNICQALIRSGAYGRAPWVPADALEYKRSESREMYEKSAASGYYYLDAATDRYRATQKLAWARA
jgi:hypothetical protein